MTNLKQNARNLRKNMTIAEQKLWQKIRNRQLNYKFLRQFVFCDKYIVDFICLEKRLVIEIDGGQHENNKEDQIRDKYISDQGFQVIRFWNNEVLNNIEGCLQYIESILQKR